MKKTWELGSMKFGNCNMKPPKMSTKEWEKSNSSRIWVSMKGETPSKFFARIISDMEKEHPEFHKEIQNEIKKLDKKVID